MNLKIFTYNLTSDNNVGIEYTDNSGNVYCLYCWMISHNNIHVRTASYPNLLYLSVDDAVFELEKDVTHEFIEDFRYNAILEAVDTHVNKMK